MIKFILFIVFFFQMHSAYAIRVKPSVREAQKSIYQIKTPTSKGTAFFVKPDVVATTFDVMGDILDQDDLSKVVLISDKGSKIKVQKLLHASFHADLVFLQTEKKSKHFLKRGKVLQRGYLYSMGYKDGEILIVQSKKSPIKLERVFSSYRIHFDYSKDFKGITGGPILNTQGEYVGINYSSANSVTYYTSAYHMSRVFSGGLGTTCNGKVSCIQKEYSKLRQHMLKYVSSSKNTSSYKVFHLRHILKKVISQSAELERLTMAYIRKGAKYNNTEALFTLGMFYLEGVGVSQNFQTAMSWFEKAAKRYHMEAQFALGALYLRGKGGLEVTSNNKKAFPWIFRSALSGLVEAQFNLGTLVSGSSGGFTPKPIQAFHWLEKAARKNYPRAQFMTANIYEKGIGTDQNSKKAFYWYKKAAENGLVESQLVVAEIFLNGDKKIGIKKNINEGKKWLKKAAEQEDTTAQFRLGVLEYNSDSKKSTKWLQRAAEAGHSQAKLMLQSNKKCQDAFK